MIRVRRLTLLLALFLGTTVLAHATNYTWNVASGNWNTAGNWLGGVVPDYNIDNTADVIISNGGTCTVNALVRCRDITITNGTLGVSGTRNITIHGSANLSGMNGFPAANLTLVMNNTTVNATLTAPTNTLLSINSLTINCSPNTVALAGTLTLAAGSALTMSSGTFSLYDAFNTLTAATLVIPATPLWTTGATLDINKGILDAHTTSINVATAGVAITQTTGTLLSIGFTISAGTYTFTDAGFLTCTGSISISAGTFTAGASTVTMKGTSTITTTPALNNFTVDAAGNTVSMASALTMNGNLSVTNGTLATGNFGFTATGTLNVSGTLDLTGSTLSTAFPPPFQVAGVGTVSTGGTIVTGNNSMWFKSDLTLDRGTFNFSGATADSTTIDVDGTLSGTTAGAATSTWTNGAAEPARSDRQAQT